MTLVEAKKLAISLMTDYDLFKKGWKFDFNNTRGSFGMCYHQRKMIYLSSVLTPLATEGSVRNTVLHEMAHALVGPGHAHDHVWRAKFISMGGDGKRCGGNDNFEDAKEARELLVKSTKYALVCPVCNHASPIARPPKNPKSCGKCSRRFNPKYLLKLVLTSDLTPQKPQEPSAIFVSTKQRDMNLTFSTSIDGNIITIEKDGSSIVYNTQTKSSKTKVSDPKESGLVKRVAQFLTDFQTKFPSIDLYTIVKQANGSKSWRHYSSNIRRAGNINVTAKGLADNAKYQEMFFYEGVMEGRKIHGANAPWLDSEASTPVRKVALASAAQKITSATVTPRKASGKTPDLAWRKVNAPIFKALGVQFDFNESE